MGSNIDLNNPGKELHLSNTIFIAVSVSNICKIPKYIYECKAMQKVYRLNILIRMY